MHAPPIELVYFTGCPHVEEARATLRVALEAAGLPAEWREWDQTDPKTPTRVLGYGSPTILVGGLDVTGKAPANAGRACRADGTPPAAAIAAALTAWRAR
jgi:hypothetical protein